MSLFPDKAQTVSALRADRLTASVGAYLSDATLSDDYLYAKVLTAEKDAEHRLRAFLEPTEMVPEGTDAQVTQQYDADDVRWRYEPAYDWDPEFFRGSQWGFIQTRQRPIIKVHYFQFTYPSTYESMYRFPHEWIKMDKKYGHIRLVPTGNTTTLPLNAWLLSVFSGGRRVPHMIQIAYQTGLKNAADDYPDLRDLIQRMAVLRILEDQFLPQSGSLSVDGLSQSLSVDYKQFQNNIDKRLESLRQQIHGVRMGFL